MGCTYYLRAAVGPVLAEMRADIETIYRFREEDQDVSEAH